MTSPVAIDAASPGTHCDPYWKRAVCGGRAYLGLRADYQECLARAARQCGFQSLRQHGIFHEDMFVWHEPDSALNFQYLYAIYDAYLARGVRPFVELSFLPRWLAKNDNTVFAVKCPACPPNDLRAWHRLVAGTARALVDRYGLEEVKSWHFEVWNEPDIGFFQGTQEEYFELYRTSCEAVKSVDAELRIGGPATANFRLDPESRTYRPSWVEDFLAFCEREALPVDFVSTHPYPTDFPFDEGTGKVRRVVRDRDATFRDLTLLRELVDAGPFPRLPIHANEWGSSPSCRDRCHDHLFDGTFHLDNLLRCIGLVDSLARWVFCDVTEEQPAAAQEFHGGWGLQTVHGLPKPSFHAYAFLHRVGPRLLRREDGLAVFRSAEGWQVLLWNHHHYADREADWETLEGAARMIGPGEARTFALELAHLPPRVRLRRRLVDEEHGWGEAAWRAMGAPDWPDAAELADLRQASEPGVTLETRATEEGTLRLQQRLGPLGFMLIEIEPV